MSVTRPCNCLVWLQQLPTFCIPIYIYLEKLLITPGSWCLAVLLIFKRQTGLSTMDSLNRKAAFLPSIPEKSKKVPNDPLDEIYDCIIVRMPSTHSAANDRSPLATLSSSSINSSNTVKPLNIFKSSHSTQTKLKFSALPVTQTPERKVRAPRSRNHRKNISPMVGKLKACAEQEVQLVSLHGEDLIGRRRSQRVAECPRVNYMEIPPISEEDNQLEE